MASRPGRSGRRRQDHSSPLVDLDLVFADDRLIDRIAESPWGPAERRSSAAGAHRRGDGGQPAPSQLATADPLTELFETWRDELAADPMPALPKLGPTLVPQPVAKPPQRRTLRPALSIAAAIAALLVGTATIGSKNATPESALWGITQVMWPDRVVSVASSGTARDAIAEAKTALQAGRSRDAQLALLRATVALGTVDDVDGLDVMTQEVKDLWVEALPPSKTVPSTTDGSAASTPDGSSTNLSDLSLLFGTTAASTLAPAPLVLATSSDPSPSELAGGVIEAPAQPQSPGSMPAFQEPTTGAVNPPDPAPSTEAPASPSPEPEPVSEVPPPSSEAPPADETTSVPPPEPVETTAPVAEPSAVDQSAPEQSAPAPTPLTQTPDPEPTVDPDPAGAVESAVPVDPTPATGP